MGLQIIEIYLYCIITLNVTCTKRKGQDVSVETSQEVGTILLSLEMANLINRKLMVF